MALDPELKMVFEKLEQDIAIVIEGQQAQGEKLDATFESVGRLSEDVTDVKEQLDLIRGDLKRKVAREEIELLEQRVTRLERRFAAA